MFGIGPMEMLVIVIIALIVLGPEKFPEAGKTVARMIREFRSATDSVTRELSLSLNDEPRYSDNNYTHSNSSVLDEDIDTQKVEAELIEEENPIYQESSFRSGSEELASQDSPADIYSSANEEAASTESSEDEVEKVLREIERQQSAGSNSLDGEIKIKPAEGHVAWGDHYRRLPDTSTPEFHEPDVTESTDVASTSEDYESNLDLPSRPKLPPI